MRRAVKINQRNTRKSYNLPCTCLTHFRMHALALETNQLLLIKIDCLLVRVVELQIQRVDKVKSVKKTVPLNPNWSYPKKRKTRMRKRKRKEWLDVFREKWKCYARNWFALKTKNVSLNENERIYVMPWKRIKDCWSKFDWLVDI